MKKALQMQRFDFGKLISAGFSFTSSLSFLFTFYAGFFVGFFTFDIADDTVFGALTLETSDSAIQCFVISNLYVCHVLTYLSPCDLS